LNSKNISIFIRDFLFGFQYLLNLRHSNRIYLLVSIESLLYEQAIDSFGKNVIYKSIYLENYIPMVKSSPKHTTLPSMAATFLATRLMVVLQSSGYSIFHGGDTPIQLSLP